jgi:hypothetical protein
MMGDLATHGEFLTWQGAVVAGHGVASGRSAGTTRNPYPQGSIAMQAPLFKTWGLDLNHCFLGTVNLSISPQAWSLRQADYCFEALRWTDLHPPETFSFASVQVDWQGAWQAGWIYHPHPETKATHFQGSDVMELILPRLVGLQEGMRLTCRAPAQTLVISDRA